MPKVEKDVIIGKVNNALDQIRDIKKDQEKLNKKLDEHGIQPGFLAEVTVDRSKLDELSPELLCTFVVEIGETTGKVDPNLLYNEVELKRAARHKEESGNKLSYPITFENVIELNPFSWVTTCNAQTIYELEQSVLKYNYETQRSAKVRVSGNDGSMITKPDVNKNSVKQISDLMATNKYKSDTITFNILLDGTDDIVYDSKNKRLVINSGDIDILDGFHRIQGLKLAVEKNPNLDLNLIVSIKNYTLEDAKFFFGQINTINQVDKTRIKQLKSERISDLITNELEKKSELQGKISSNTRITGSVGHITNFAVISDAIEDIFKPKDRKDFIDISPHLIDFFSYLLGSFKSEFGKEYEETKKRSWINHHNMFVGYVVLAKKFYDSNQSLRKLVEIINGINFEKGSSPFDAILNGSGKDNSNKVKRLIKEYFEKIEI